MTKTSSLSSETKSPPTRKKRKRYDNNLKARVLEELRVPGVRLVTICEKYGLPQSTLRDWTKDSSIQSIEGARQKCDGGTLKANMSDPLQKLSDSLMAFLRRDGSVQTEVTTKLVVSKGLEAKKKLLELHEIQPFLTPREKKALDDFRGSNSWAKKFAKRHHLRMSGARKKKLGEEEVQRLASDLRTIAARVKQAGPSFHEVVLLLNQASEKLLTIQMISSREDQATAKSRKSG